MKIARISMLTGKRHVRDLAVTDQQIADWQSGQPIQRVMPHLSPDDREFLMTGTTPDEWERRFGKDEAEAQAGVVAQNSGRIDVV